MIRISSLCNINLHSVFAANLLLEYEVLLIVKIMPSKLFWNYQFLYERKHEKLVNSYVDVLEWLLWNAQLRIFAIIKILLLIYFYHLYSCCFYFLIGFGFYQFNLRNLKVIIFLFKLWFYVLCLVNLKEYISECIKFVLTCLLIDGFFIYKFY